MVFLTGQAEIDKAVRALGDAVRGLPAGACGDLEVLPLYAALPSEMQVRKSGGEGAGVLAVVFVWELLVVWRPG